MLWLAGHGGIPTGVTEAPLQDLLVWRGEVQIVLGDQCPDEREPVRVEAARTQTHDRVARLDSPPVDQLVPLHDPHTAAGKIEHLGIQEARMLRSLAPDQ